MCTRVNPYCMRHLNTFPSEAYNRSDADVCTSTLRTGADTHGQNFGGSTVSLYYRAVETHGNDG
jgi:hypothetical protein